MTITVAVFVLVAVLLFFYLKSYLQKFQELVHEGNLVYQKLEELLEHCQEISAQTIDDLEQKIISLENIYEEQNKMLVKKPFQKTQKKEKISKNEETDYFKPPAQYLSIINLKKAGWAVKDIAKELGLGQDHIEMILNVFQERV